MFRRPPFFRESRGFTLIEVLVVLAIIATLAAIVLPQLFKSTESGEVVATRTRLEALTSAITNYKSRWGDYPPSRLKRLPMGKIEGQNDKNEGVEALVVALSTRKKNGPFMDWQEDYLENTDGDSLGKPLSSSAIQSENLYEVVDFWGNPFVYIHCRDYKKKMKFVDAEGNIFTARAQKSKKLGTFHNADSYQMWSIGPNGKNEDGGGDDVPNFTISDSDDDGEDEGPP